MADQSMMENSSISTAVATNPCEFALQSLCKQLLKSRLFRGFYVERRYVESVKGYRDIVCLQKSEKSFEKKLRDIRDKLQLFYSYKNPQMWIGITSGTLTGISISQLSALETYLWVEMNGIAFGQYWFSVKSIRFRDNEILLKIKEIQPIEENETPMKPFPTASTNAICDKNDCIETSKVSSRTAQTTTDVLDNQVTFDDFILLLHRWWTSIKQTLYDFMSQDISKQNIIGVLRFFGLLIVSIISGALMGIKFLGIFTLRFMFELSRLTYALTPIILKIIEVFNKIVGGFYIILAMIWKDAIVNRNQPKYNALEYNRPMYESIQHEVRQRRLGSSSATCDRSVQ